MSIERTSWLTTDEASAIESVTPRAIRKRIAENKYPSVLIQIVKDENNTDQYLLHKNAFTYNNSKKEWLTVIEFAAREGKKENAIHKMTGIKRDNGRKLFDKKFLKTINGKVHIHKCLLSSEVKRNQDRAFNRRELTSEFKHLIFDMINNPDKTTEILSKLESYLP